MSTPSPAERSLRAARACSIIVISVGLLILLGRALELRVLMQPVGPSPTTADAALCAVVAGVSLLLWATSRAVTGWLALLARALGGVVSLIVVLVWAGFGPQSHMGPGAAIAFLCFGLALAFFEEEVAGARIAEILTLVAFSAAVVVGVDLLLGVFSIDDAVPAYRRTSLPALVVLLLLSHATLSARPERGWTRLLTSGTPVSIASRHLLAWLAPILVGLSVLRYLGEQLALFDTRYGVALMVGVSLLSLFALTLRTLRMVAVLEEKERTAHRMLNAIVEHIPHMIFVKDERELRFQHFNRGGELLLGVPREQVLGRCDLDLFPREQAEFFQQKDRDTLAAGAIVDIPEEQIDTPAGPRWLHTLKIPVVGSGAADGFLLGISEDITDRKASEDELRRAKEIAEANSRELEAFSYSVSHDLRTPLRSIDGFSQAILEDCGDILPPEGQEHLTRVRAAAQRMSHLIDDLLDLARVSRHVLNREPVDVTQLATTVVEELRRATPLRAVEVHIARGMQAHADRRLLLILLENLIGNAWKFTGKVDHPRIEIGMVADLRAHFYVRDNGAGFDMAYANKLFGAFERLHSAVEYEGTGVGLATVLRIVQRHGGRAWGEGAVGEGATFHVTIPEE